MRIIGGVWRGRSIFAPKGCGTRPTTDRVRESLFSMLEARLPGGLTRCRVLDAFAGSGALGLEALSRGAARCDFFEADRGALEALRRNVASLGAQDKATVVPSDVLRRTPRATGGQFDLVFLDPPYDTPVNDITRLIDDLATSRMLNAACLVSWEHSASREVAWPIGFASQGTRRYGLTAIDLATYEPDGPAEGENQ